MIRSMTGFGSASTQVDGTHYALEIRSLNNRYFKTQVRLPEELQGLEAELESRVAKRLSRGSIVINVRFSDTSADAAATINTNAIQRYLEQLLKIPGVAHDAARIDVGTLLSFPGVLISDHAQELLDRSRPVLFELLDEACESLVSMRKREGAMLHQELHGHCRSIAEHLAVVAERVPGVVKLYQQKLLQRMESMLIESGATAREEDLVREVAVFAEKSDIAEEVARLQGHLSQFAEMIDTRSGSPTGRTLDFISQEMLREANTIGSKCLDVEVSRRIVEIKGSIDRIKEQVQNVE